MQNYVVDITFGFIMFYSDSVHQMLNAKLANILKQKHYLQLIFYKMLLCKTNLKGKLRRKVETTNQDISVGWKRIFSSFNYIHLVYFVHKKITVQCFVYYSENIGVWREVYRRSTLGVEADKYNAHTNTLAHSHTHTHIHTVRNVNRLVGVCFWHFTLIEILVIKWERFSSFTRP